MSSTASPVRSRNVSDELGGTGALERFPRLLAFSSVVDATVSTPALVEGLFERLPAGDHELVLFDINRMAEIEPIMRSDPIGEIQALLGRSGADLHLESGHQQGRQPP